MKNIDSKDDRKSAGAQAALWVYAFAGLLALVPSAMNDETSLALMLSFVVLYAVGLFVVDALGKRNRGALLASVAAAAIVVVFLTPLASIVRAPSTTGGDASLI